MPPAAASAIVAPGSGGRRPGGRCAHRQVAAHGQIVEIVSRPAAIAGRPGRSRSSSSRRSRGFAPPRPRSRCRAGRRHPDGSSRRRRRPWPPGREMPRGPRRLGCRALRARSPRPPPYEKKGGSVGAGPRPGNRSDLHDLCAEVTENPGAPRRRPDGRKVEHRQTCEGRRSRPVARRGRQEVTRRRDRLTVTLRNSSAGRACAWR